MKTNPSTLLVCALAFCLLALRVSAADDVVGSGKDAITIHPINHATLSLSCNGVTVYADPVGEAKRFADLPAADVILVTDIHGDHMSAATLEAIAKDKTQIVVPAAVAEKLTEALKSKLVILKNGETKEVHGVKITAVPMYNLTTERLKFHDKGRGNGYVVEMGGKRIYLSGDTEDIPEMRSLKNIDVAFVCMNLPYTMTEAQAASAVREFHPKMVYPYHYRGSDLEKFKTLVGTDVGVEVRIRDWYAK